MSDRSAIQKIIDFTHAQEEFFNTVKKLVREEDILRDLNSHLSIRQVADETAERFHVLKEELYEATLVHFLSKMDSNTELEIQNESLEVEVDNLRSQLLAAETGKAIFEREVKHLRAALSGDAEVEFVTQEENNRRRNQIRRIEEALMEVTLDDCDFGPWQSTEQWIKLLAKKHLEYQRALELIKIQDYATPEGGNISEQKPGTIAELCRHDAATLAEALQVCANLARKALKGKD